MYVPCSEIIYESYRIMVNFTQKFVTSLMMVREKYRRLESKIYQLQINKF